MLIPNKFNGYHNGTRQLHISSGGGGGGGQTTSTVQNTNVPEYARPYVETMLGATQEQLFQGNRTPVTTDPNTGLTTGGEFNITGFKPYQAYGGTYDAQGKQLSYDPSKAIAGFSPMQTAAQQGIAGMEMPGQFGAASDFAAQAGMGGLRSAQDAMRFGNAGFESGQRGQQLGIAGGQLGIAGGQKYGEMGAGYGALGAGYGAQAADIGKMGLRAETYGRQVSGQAEDYARQAAGAGQRYATEATSPQAMQAYMSPYMQNVVDIQNREAARASNIIGTQQQAQATQAGAYGGGRDAIMRAERERNLAMLQNQNQAQGMQAAYQQAQQAQQFGANLGLQGLQGAQQGLGTALQGGQLGLSGIGTALQGMRFKVLILNCLVLIVSWLVQHRACRALKLASKVCLALKQVMVWLIKLALTWQILVHNNKPLNLVFMALKARRARNSRLWNSRRLTKLCKITLMHSSTPLCSWAQCLTCCAVCQCRHLQLTNIKLRLINCRKQLVRLVLVRLSITL